MLKFIEKIKRRNEARQEHNSINELYYLPFEQELQIRLRIKKNMLKNEIMEVLNLDKNDICNIVEIENLIEEKKQQGFIDEFYNKVYK